MINVNDFKTGMTISYDGNIYQVLEFQHVKPGKGAAIVKAKLKNFSSFPDYKGLIKAQVGRPTYVAKKDIKISDVESKAKTRGYSRKMGKK